MSEKAYVEVNDENFEEEVLGCKIPVLVDFWAEWCRPCLALAPTIDALAVQYKGRVKVCKLNVDQAQITATAYSIMGIPTLLLFKNGEVVDRTVGSVPKATLEKVLGANIGGG